MPYPNEHACRLRDPGDFQPDSFRRTQREHEGKTYACIMGRLKGETTMTEQAYRYPKDAWDADEARAHCADHDGTFEAAGEEDSSRCGPCARFDDLVRDIKAVLPAVEHRVFPLVEVRVEGNDEEPRIVGHAAVFDQLSVPLWGFREKIARGAFTKTIKEADVRALWNHDANFVLGRIKAKTLSLSEDEVGLAIDVTPPKTTWARDLIVTMRRGDVDQASFGFRTIKDSWEQDHDQGTVIRTLKEVELFDVSPVTFPAYPQTDMQVRSLQSVLRNYFPTEPLPAEHSGRSVALARRRLTLKEHS